MADAELRGAIAAFLRAWCSLAAREMGEERLEKWVDMMINSEPGFVEMFRMFHAQHNRYPTFEELHPPGSISVYDTPPIIPHIRSLEDKNHG